MRDVPELTREALRERCGFSQADAMVLFGGSILEGGRVLAAAMQEGVARTYVIVGGAGHTTGALRRKMHEAFPSIETANKTEAEVFEAYLEHEHGLRADYLETASTNCGNNITYLLGLLDEHGIAGRSIILAQDATMQRRMDAGMRKFAPKMEIVNFATYRAIVEERAGELAYAEPVWGMWDIDRYATLLMGEIPRLTDGPDGYGPAGKDFIAHVDIPQDARESFGRLCEAGIGEVRAANSAFAS